MGAGQSSEEWPHPDLSGEGSDWNGTPHGHYPGMLALPTAPTAPTAPARPAPPTPSELQAPALPQVPFELILLINKYRKYVRLHPETYDTASMLPEQIWQKTTSPSPWSFPDICMVFGNQNFQTWAYRRYVDGTENAELKKLNERLSMWLNAASIFETRTLRTDELGREQTFIEEHSHMRGVDLMFAYFKLLNEFCTFDRYESLRNATAR